MESLRPASLGDAKALDLAAKSRQDGAFPPLAFTRMSSFSFSTVAQVIIQTGAAQNIGEILSQRFPPGRVMAVTDKFLVRSGLLEPAFASLRAHGWELLVCDDVEADPPDHVVEKAAARARDFGATLVLGVGGGSSMDVAKLVAVLAAGDQPLSAMYGIDKVSGGRLALVHIPTTAGTGSEVTPVAIVTTGATTKSGIVARQLYADLAVLDAELTVGLPSAITAATGIDAMVHAIEAFTSKRLKNPLSDHAATLALKLLSTNLEKVCVNGKDLAAREAMLLGSMLAGQAFANAPVAAVHALAYPLGGRYHLPHGLTNALVLPHVLRFNASTHPQGYAELGAALGLAQTGTHAERAADFIAHIVALIEKTALPMRLRDHGVAEDMIATLAADAMLQERLLMNNPRPLTVDDALAIYSAAF